MTNFLQTGVAWLNSMRNTHLTDSVTYRRGLSEVTINATRGRTATSIASDEGVEIAGQIDDWIVDETDLVLDGCLVKPEHGDQIRETTNGRTIVYEVQVGPDGEAWRYSDSFKESLRIHTVRTAID